MILLLIPHISGGFLPSAGKNFKFGVQGFGFQSLDRGSGEQLGFGNSGFDVAECRI